MICLCVCATPLLDGFTSPCLLLLAVFFGSIHAGSIPSPGPAGTAALHGDRHGAASSASSAADARQVDKRRFHSGSGSPEASSVNFIRQATRLGSPSKAPIDHLKHEEPQPAGDLACRLCPATCISRLTVKCFGAALPGRNFPSTQQQARRHFEITP